MAENKPSINNPSAAAARIAEQNKAAKEAEDQLKKEAEAKEQAQVNKEQAGQTDTSGNDNITIGATTGGRMMQNVTGPTGVQEVQQAPGYYSRHAGKVRIGQTVWKWPMEAPLVPKENEEELREYLDSMVERGLATYVGDKTDDKSE